MSQSSIRPAFSARGFAFTVFEIFAVFGLALAALLWLGISQSDRGSLLPLNAILLTMVSGFVVLIFGAAWGLAYGKYFSYPDRRAILIAGTLASPVWFIVLWVLAFGLLPSTSWQPPFPETTGALVLQMIMGYVVLVPTAGLQVFGIAIGFRILGIEKTFY